MTLMQGGASEDYTESFMQKYDLWQDNKTEVTMDYYPPLRKSTNAAVVILPGGGYSHLADHEGLGYAQMLNVFGITAFVVKYRVFPNLFPMPLSDARRAMRFVCSKAEQFDLDKDKILIMGSSAGGHLAALLCTYQKDIGEPKDALFRFGVEKMYSDCITGTGNVSVFMAICLMIVTVMK